jgi:hypothetical protein
MKCEKQLSECTCPDLEERLQRLSESPHLHPQTVARVRIDREQKQNRPDTKPEKN